jgi:hypothetical protein
MGVYIQPKYVHENNSFSKNCACQDSTGMDENSCSALGVCCSCICVHQANQKTKRLNSKSRYFIEHKLYSKKDREGNTFPILSGVIKASAVYY